MPQTLCPEVRGLYIPSAFKLKNPIYRLCLGDLIDQRQRKTYPYRESSGVIPTYSGSIGFIDIQLQDRFAPPGKESINNQRLWSTTPALVILMMGVEPQYRRRGWGSFLLHEAEQISKRQCLDAVIYDEIDSPEEEMMLFQNGYDRFDSIHAIKFLSRCP